MLYPVNELSLRFVMITYKIKMRFFLLLLLITVDFFFCFVWWCSGSHCHLKTQRSLVGFWAWVTVYAEFSPKSTWVSSMFSNYLPLHRNMLLGELAKINCLGVCVNECMCVHGALWRTGIPSCPTPSGSTTIKHKTEQHPITSTFKRIWLFKIFYFSSLWENPYVEDSTLLGVGFNSTENLQGFLQRENWGTIKVLWMF